MSRNEFLTIKSKLRFYKQEDKNVKDKVWKVRRIYNLFRQKLTQFGWWSPNLSIDEVMVKYFGHFGIKQCIRSKPIRFGIKQWAVCSPEGYVFDLDIYTGKNCSENEETLQAVGLGSRVILKMLHGLFSSVPRDHLSRYHIYFDNFFTSPDLMVHLKKVGVNATGTMRQNRMKSAIELNKKAERGTTVCMHDAVSKINYITVMDSKQVSILSTTHGDDPKVAMSRSVNKSKQSIEFPHAFHEYNKKMGGVDQHDQHCNSAMPSIRGKKWTWCLFTRLIQAAVTNATVLHNIASPDNVKGTKDIAEEICEYYLDEVTKTRESKKRKVNVKKRAPMQHEIKQGVQKSCQFKSSTENLCAKRTFLYCVTCNVHLCSLHSTQHKLL